MTDEQKQILRDELLVYLKDRLEEFYEHGDRTEYEDRYEVDLGRSATGMETILTAAMKRVADPLMFMFCSDADYFRKTSYRERFCAPFLTQARTLIENSYYEAWKHGQCFAGEIEEEYD